MLWVDVTSASEDEARAVERVFGLAGPLTLEASGRKPRLEQKGGYLAVTAVAVSDGERDVDNERILLDCFVASNWLLTAYSAAVAVIDEFRETVSGEGELGALDAPSFLATLLEWVVSSYLRAFDEIETDLEDFDIKALSGPSQHPDAQITLLIAARQRVGRLRRSLAPHRDVLAH